MSAATKTNAQEGRTMDTRNLVVGSRIEHGGYGVGVVTG